MRTAISMMAMLLVSACAGTQTDAQLNLCQGERPQMCTMIYQPVCGTNDSGESKTYASDCVACSHAEVIGYVEEACVD